MKMSEPKRLHPISAAANFFKQLKELIVPFLVFIVFGFKNSNWDLFYLIGSAAVVLLVLAGGILKWLRFTYRVEEGELRIEYGVFVRKKRYIPFERIQSLDFSEGILHRPFGLVKVKVETAGTSGTQEAEATLTAITKAEAAAIQAELTAEKAAGDLEKEKTLKAGQDIYKISPGQLLLLASTSGGAGVVISAVIAFFFQFEEIIPYEALFHRFEHFAENGVIFISGAVFLLLLLAWIIAVIGTMLKYAGFTVRREEDDLVISRGLLEKKQLTIPLHRIQALRFSENPARQPLGFGTLYVESAGGSAVDRDSAKVMLFPLIQKKDLRELVGRHLTDYDAGIQLAGLPKRALPRYLFRGLLAAALFIIVPPAIIRPWGFLSLLLLLPAVAWPLLKFRAAGWHISGSQLTLRYRAFSKHTVYMMKNKVQSLSLKESRFQKRKQLATVEATVKSGSGGSGGKAADLDISGAEEIYRWYSRES
jgi:putative membrane protein